MYKILTVENMRKSDAYTIANYVPSKELMNSAGTGAFQEICKMIQRGEVSGVTTLEDISPVAIVCGSGNNAGDGYVMSKLFDEDGIDVELILLKEKFSPDGKFYFDQCAEQGISWKIFDEVAGDFRNFGCIIDCILGTGFKGDVRGQAAQAIRRMNAQGKFVVSVDINSGLNGDTGQASLAVKSDLTISIGGYKTGFFLEDASHYIGKLVNVDIGIEPVDKPFLLVTEEERKALPKDAFDKNIVITTAEELEKHLKQESSQ